MLLAQQIIDKKALSKEHTYQEISDFLNHYAIGIIKDYQVSAWLMAIRLNGLTRCETRAFTDVMVKSGATFKWSQEHVCVDKHSTGGVGDKTSLIIAALCYCDSIPVPMIAGRGLGHSGGTIDKLESIPGFQSCLKSDQAKKLFDKQNFFLIGQNEDVAPLDKRLYALRDVTATVPSIPLITASILSKKLSEGLQGLVMDIKCGSGAFMHTLNEAEDLGNSIKEVGRLFELDVRACITNMNSPLGRQAGNKLEVLECLEIFNGSGPKDTKELSLHLAAGMAVISLGGAFAEHYSRFETYLSNGKAFEAFCSLISSQGGDLEAFSKNSSSTNIYPIFPDKNGFIQSIDVEEIGWVIVELGGGRKALTEQINHDVGLSNLCHVGEKVSTSTPLLQVHAQSSADFEAIKERLKNAIEICSDQVKVQPLIIKEI